MRRLVIPLLAALAAAGLLALPASGAVASTSGASDAKKAKRCPRGYVRTTTTVKVGRKRVRRSVCRKPKPARRRCPRGYVRKPIVVQVGRKRVVQSICVRPAPGSPTGPTPGVDALARPGTYHGSKGVTVTTAKPSELDTRVSITVPIAAGYTFCRPGRQTAITVGIADMQVSSFGAFGVMKPTPGGYTKITGSFLGGNTLKIAVQATGVRVGRQVCGGQISSMTVYL